MQDIAMAYKIDLDKEPDTGLILPGATLATPVIDLNNKVFITSDWQNNPVSLWVYGEDGSETVVDGFEYGMAFENLPYDIREDFIEGVYKTSENGEEESMKVLERFIDLLHIKMFFLGNGENLHTLDSVKVSLK